MKNKNNFIGVLLSDRELERLEIIAKHHGDTKSTAMRKLINSGWAGLQLRKELNFRINSN